MNLNPFTIRYGYHLAQRRARLRSQKWAARLERLESVNGDASARRLPIQVVCMLGRKAMAEATVTVRSLLLHAGRPDALTLVSDGSLTADDRTTLERALAPGRVVDLEDIIADDLPRPVADRLEDHWMVRKQAVLMSLPRDRPALFIDSDVVFFPGAVSLASDLAKLGDRPAFMADINPSLDSNLLRGGDPLDPPLNSGFLYQPRSLDWSLAVDRFAALPLDGRLAFTDQTMSHLTFHAAGAAALDPGRYVLKIDDQFRFADRYANRPSVVCRHYVGTIRHKMWLAAR